MNPHLYTSNPVGKSVANWSPGFANWTQLEEVCQLDSHMNQQLRFSWQLATKNRFANLPTELSPCFYSYFTQNPVGNKPPSYYVGKGTKVPSDLRRMADAVVDTGVDVGVYVGGVGDDMAPTRCLVLLAIDLGTTTGWALRPRDGQIAHGYLRAFFGVGERRVPVGSVRRQLSRTERILRAVDGNADRARKAWLSYGASAPRRGHEPSHPHRRRGRAG